MEDRLRELASPALLELEAKCQQRLVLDERLNRLAAERASVSEGVFARVQADYQSRLAALDQEKAAPAAKVQADLETLLGLRAEVEQGLDSIRLDQEELELRDRLGEFEASELEPKLVDLRERRQVCEHQLQAILALETRIEAALGERPAPIAPARPAEPVKPAKESSPRSTKSSAKITVERPPVEPPPVEPPPVEPPPVAEVPVAAAPAEPAEPATVVPPPAPYFPAAPVPPPPINSELPTTLLQPASAPPNEAPLQPPPFTPVPFMPIPQDLGPPREPSSPIAIDLAPPTVEPTDDDERSGITAELQGRTTLLPIVEDTGPSMASGRTTVLELAFLVPIEPIPGIAGEVPLEPLTTVGRTNQNQLQLAVPEISRQHAQVVLTNDGWLVRDLGAENGTFVNNSRIKEQILQNGDIVRFSTLGFTFRAVVHG